MAKETQITLEQQRDVSQYIQETFDNYENLSSERRENLLDIYEEYRSFRQPKTADWSSTFKVNKAHEIVNKMLPRIIAKNPRWLVSLRTDEFVDDDKLITGEEKLKRMEDLRKMAL
jgi:hypothetical protein